MSQRDTEFDLLIIGAGVAGCCLARELARYDIRCAVLEAGNDVAFATSRANSGIVHAGYDPEPGSLKARYCARGARLFAQWAEELEFAYLNTGSLVLAFTDDEVATLRVLQERAAHNDVTVELLDAKQVKQREPQVSDAVLAGLYAPEAGICDPYGITFAAAEHAVENGVEFLFEQQVVALEKTSSGFAVTCSNGTRYTSTLVVNAAGVFADELNDVLSSNSFSITPVRGEYLLYDTAYGSTFSHVMFQAPGKLGKGVLITPTVHGNLLIGPNALAQQSKTDVSTSAHGLENVLAQAQKTWPKASTQGVITNFAGLRAKGSEGDFIIGEAPDVAGFFNIACFESPGLTAAPAVAVELAQRLASLLAAKPRASFNPRRKRSGHKLFALMNPEEQREAVASDENEGKVVCRCCNVTKADLLFELDASLPVLSLDSLKWRTGIMMGRCHGGFCAPELMSIIHEHTGIAPEEIDKRLPESPYVVQSSAAYKHDVAQEEHVSPGASSLSPAPAKPFNTLFDVLVVGAGAAGMAAAQAAIKEGAQNVALLDRESFLGGILRQCIHNGFGLTRFKKELTGPEYASKEAAKLSLEGITLLLDTMVLSLELSDDPQGVHTVIAASAEGLISFKTKALVLATGSRERGQGALNLAGSRPAGVYPAGSAQNLINLKGCLPGRRVVIQGSGDIGLIMARRCLFSGAEVLGVLARSSKPSGLQRNVRQCLDDFGIPFYGNSLVTRLEGEGRLEAVWVSKVDPDTKQIIEGSEERWPCDTLLLSIGLIPESELANAAGIELDAKNGSPQVDSLLETSATGVFVCGNALHIHDLADSASFEGERAGKHAAQHALGQSSAARVKAGQPESVSNESECAPAESGLTSIEPESAPAKSDLTSVASDQTTAEPSLLLAEPDLLLTCVRCPKSCELSVMLAEDGTVAEVTGEGCKLGRAYAEEEITAPTRIVTVSLPIAGTLEPLSVKTAQPVPKECIFAVLDEAYALELTSPIDEGTLLVDNVANTGVALIATKSV